MLSWIGTCNDREVQEELIGYLWELAVRNATRRMNWPRHLHPAPMLMRRRDEALLQPYDQELSGRILIDMQITANDKHLKNEIQSAGPEFIAITPNLFSGDPINLFVLSRIHVYGIEFDVADPCRGSEGRMSFVFMTNPTLPTLDGRLVRIEREPYWMRDSDFWGLDKATVPTGDFYVSLPLWGNPSHAYLRRWSDFLLAWTKRFFIPDLLLSDFFFPDIDLREHITRIHAFCGEYGEEFTKRGMWDYLMQCFEHEFDVWTPPL